MSEVSIAQLRRDLKDWLERARAGDEVVVTDRGQPIARLTGIEQSPALERLTAEGRISPVVRPRPRATTLPRIPASGDVSGFVTSERDARRP